MEREQQDSQTHDLPPEDLDALLEALQKGAPSFLPRDHHAEEHYLEELIHIARRANLDDGYAARLESHLRRTRSRAVPHPDLQVRLPAHTRQSWRRMAVAFSVVTLVTVLGLSSVVVSRVPQISANAPLSNWYNGGLLAASALPPWQTETLGDLPRTGSGMQTTTSDAFTTPQDDSISTGTIYSLYPVKAPAPPHTPLPDPHTLIPTTLGH